MMDTKPICNRFSTPFIMLEKRVSKILLWHCLAILTLFVVKFNMFLRLLTNENIIFMCKIVR